MKKNTLWMVVLFVVGLMAWTGCVHHVAHAKHQSAIVGVSPWNNASCQRVVDQRDNARTAGKILVGVGGASAITTAIPDLSDDPQKSQRIRWGIGVSSAVISVVGGALIWYGEQKDEVFDQHCDIQRP